MGDKVTFWTILAKDPFYQAGIAEYDITEFIPSMAAEGFEKVMTGGERTTVDSWGL